MSRLAVENFCIYPGDAAEFTAYDHYSYIYMFNPFHRDVMEAVLQNIRESLRRTPRQLRIVYKNPTAEDLVLAAGFARGWVGDVTY